MKIEEGMHLHKASPDQKYTDISSCRVLRGRSGGMAECMVKEPCQWAMYVEHALGSIVPACGHPLEKKIAEVAVCRQS